MFGEFAGQLVAAAGGKLRTDTDAPRKRETTVLDADGGAHRFLVAALPTACSRHNTPARSDAVSTVMRGENLDCARWHAKPAGSPRRSLPSVMVPRLLRRSSRRGNGAGAL